MQGIGFDIRLRPLSSRFRFGAVVVRHIGGNPIQVGSWIFEGGAFGIVDQTQISIVNNIARLIFPYTLACESIQLGGVVFVEEVQIAFRGSRHRWKWFAVGTRKLLSRHKPPRRPRILQSIQINQMRHIVAPKSAKKEAPLGGMGLERLVFLWG